LFLSEGTSTPTIEDSKTSQIQEEANNGETEPRKPGRRRTRSRRDRRVPIRPTPSTEAGFSVSSDSPAVPVAPRFEPSLTAQPEPAAIQLPGTYPAVARETDLREAGSALEE
jgi:hypothetical protein